MNQEKPQEKENPMEPKDLARMLIDLDQYVATSAPARRGRQGKVQELMTALLAHENVVVVLCPVEMIQKIGTEKLLDRAKREFPGVHNVYIYTSVGALHNSLKSYRRTIDWGKTQRKVIPQLKVDFRLITPEALTTE